MPPIRRGLRRAAGVAKSPYESRTYVLLVGEEEARFTVHSGLLKRTTFFERHGAPRPTKPARERTLSPKPRRAPGHAASFLFPEREQTVTSDTEEPPVIDITDDDWNYSLRGRWFYSRASFQVFYRYLNEAPVDSVTDTEGCQALFGAYALAVFYEAPELQNQIIEMLQAYYSKTTIPLMDLSFVIQNFNHNQYIYQYVLQQAAYEMAIDYDKFYADNPKLDQLLTNSGGEVVRLLFKAAMSYAKPTESMDPAKNRRQWRV